MTDADRMRQARIAYEGGRVWDGLRHASWLLMAGVLAGFAGWSNVATVALIVGAGAAALMWRGQAHQPMARLMLALSPLLLLLMLGWPGIQC